MSKVNQNFQEDRFSEELTQEELENIKGGFNNLPNLPKSIKIILPPIIGILQFPPKDFQRK